MLKLLADRMWVFDLEWVPDTNTGRRVYNLPEATPDDLVLQRMFAEGGATAVDPRPYLKTVFCRVISVAAVVREKRSNGVRLNLRTIPQRGEGGLAERVLLNRFFDGIQKWDEGQAQRGKNNCGPQLVGFNLQNADLQILVQRGVALGLSAPAFCRRPAKPWDGRDYFAGRNDWCVDLKELLGGWGKASPSLHEIATTSRIPGKIGIDGGDVLALWTAGDIDRIIEYNEHDALTTYLLWLRTAHFAGLLSAEEYAIESASLERLLQERSEAGEAHLGLYLARWRQIRGDAAS